MKKLFSLLLLAMASVTLMAQETCSPITSLPWSEGFEGMTAGSSSSPKLTCWDLLNCNQGTQPYVYANNKSGYYHNGSKSLYMVSGKYRCAYAILPEITADLSQAYIDFWYRNESLSSSNGILSVGYITNPTDSATFVALQTLALVDQFTEVEQSLATVPAGARLAFRYAGQASANYYLGIDDIIIYNPTCYRPSNIHLVEDLTTASSVTLAWSAPDEVPAQYRVVVADGTDTLVNTLTTDTFCLVSGLDPATSYTFTTTVKSVCDEDNESLAAIVSLTMQTDCEATTSFPWSEDFEEMSSGTINAQCWINKHISGNGSSRFMVTASTNGSNSTHQGYLPDMAYGTITQLRLPMMDFGTPYAYKMSIDVFRNGTYAGYAGEGLRIFAGEEELGFISRLYSVADGERVPAETEIGWYTYEFVIPIGGEQRITIQGENRYGSNTFFDNIVVKNAPTCPQPTGIHILDDLTTSSSATIAWDNTGAEQYRAIVTSGTDTLVNTLVTDTFCLVSGLNPATSYTLGVSVASVCGEDNESLTAKAILTVTTPCATISSLPWNEGFENYALGSSTSPNLTCWDLLNFNTGGNLNAYVSNTYVHTGSRSLRMNSYKNRMGYAILPEITADLSRAEISFWYRNEGTNTSNGILAIGYMTDIADSTSFVALQELDRIDTFTEVTQSLATVPTGARIAFRYDCKATNYILGIDDISINSLTCQQPSNLHIVDGLTTATSATIAWSAPANGAEQYRVVVTNGTNVNDTLLSTLTTDTFCLVALKTGTSYTLSTAVTSVCGEEESSAAVASLTVETPCELITSFPWTEDFEGMAVQQEIPAGCWTNEHISGNGSYLFMVTVNHQGDNGGNSTRNAYLPDMSAGTITRLGLPMMDFGQPNTYRFSIDIYRNTSYAGCVAEGLRIFAGEEELGFISCNYTVADGTRVPAESEIGWYTYQFVIPVGGEQRIIIQGESQHGETTHFDNLVVDLAPSTPTALPAAAASDALRAAKFVRDGHIYIVLPDGTTFDATGRRVN